MIAREGEEKGKELRDPMAVFAMTKACEPI
jgi:hypothetical protein